MSTLKHL
jgi:hypothetical protein